MRQIKQIIKTIIANILFYSGTLIILKNIKLRNKCLVLTYHRVLDDRDASASYSNLSIIVHSELFKQQIEFIKKNFKPITLQKFTACLSRGEFNNSQCLITFDDGWIDNYVHAYPILKNMNVPATIFLATDYINSNKIFWQEEITWLLTNAYKTRNTKALGYINLESIINYPLEKALEEIYQIISKLKRVPRDEVNSLIKKIKSKVVGKNEKYKGNNFLNWEQIKEMSSNNIDFASHGCSHTIMTRLNEKILLSELKNSKAKIEESLGNQVNALAYPNGDFDESTKDAVSKAGYSLAFSTIKGYISPHDDKYDLKRINIHSACSKSIPIFYCKILGVF